MFDIFKKEIKIKDTVKLYLTTGKEPEGKVIEIGDSFVLLEDLNQVKSRYFDKIIGGWDILNSEPIINKPPELKENGQIPKEHYILQHINIIKELLPNSFQDILIEPNANIFKVHGSTCQARNDEYSKILIINSKINDEKLINEITHFQLGDIIPVSCLYYKNKKKDNEAILITAILPKKISELIELIIELINERKFQNANSLLPFIKNIIGKVVFDKKNDKNILRKEIQRLSHELRKGKQIKSVNKSLPINENLRIDNTNFKEIEKEINKDIRSSRFDDAILKIENNLKSDIPVKYKSSLLLKKAQIYSSLNEPKNCENAYVELIKFNERYNPSKNNLSHLYTELARLQSTNLEKIKDAIHNIKSALKLNPNNAFAEKLLSQLTSKSDIKNIENLSDIENADDSLIIKDFKDDKSISKLIDIDLDEHKFTHRLIISNDGKPTPEIAKRLLEIAAAKKEGELADRYPLYLEAAKAFKELNVGSYNTQDYLQAIAFYSVLKGNSLFIKFRNHIKSNELDLKTLTRLKDSASSYYIEALNLLTEIEPSLLLIILTNYIKQNVVLYFLQSNKYQEALKAFKGQFSSVFSICVKHTDENLEKIAYSSIIECGAASIQAWNKLALLPKGTGRLYNEFHQNKNKLRIYSLLNKLENVNISSELTAGIFFKNIFSSRQGFSKNFTKTFNSLLLIEFTVQNIKNIIPIWENLNSFDRLLSETDKEIKNNGTKIIQILEPYLNRNQSERLNILIQAKTLIEQQLEFISINTTYYGRTLYYSLFKKWLKKINNLIEERISKSYPVFETIIDPAYILEKDNSFYVPVLIKNIGESTSIGYSLDFSINKNKSISKSEKIEVPAGSKFTIDIPINKEDISKNDVVYLTFLISPIYQNKILDANKSQFTLEIEPNTHLTYEDIPWKDGPIPIEQMFKGRRKLVMDLTQHYLSVDRDKPYILYGLTRTGKSSILTYLKKEIEDEEIRIQNETYKIVTFSWDFSEAASQDKASDFYYYTLHEQTYEEILKKCKNLSTANIKISENMRFKDFKRILEYLHENKYFPIFLIDEFSFIRNLMDKKIINSAYLHSLRQFSLNQLASFIFSGTYDIKQLIKDEKYGITGQLVNTIEHQVNEIKPIYSDELIKVIDDKVSFTKEAIEHIKFLSGNVPYFIQIICKNCGYYAVENRRRHIGYPELEKIIDILTGKTEASHQSLIKKLPEGAFQNNQFSPQDPKEVACLISTIEFLNRENIKPRGISYGELEKFWAEKNMTAFRPRLAEAITILKDKKIVYQYKDETIPVYTLSVDLFRRWWSNHHSDINLVFNTLIEG